MIHFDLTYAEAALIAVSIALVLMVVAYLRNDSRWCDKYNALLTGCRVDHQGWTMQRSGILRGMAIPPPPPMPAHLRGHQPINDDPRAPNPPPAKP